MLMENQGRDHLRDWKTINRDPRTSTAYTLINTLFLCNMPMETELHAHTQTHTHTHTHTHTQTQEPPHTHTHTLTIYLEGLLLLNI